MTITTEQLKRLSEGDLVWLPGHFMKYRVDRVEMEPVPDWRNTQGQPRVVAHRVRLPHVYDPAGWDTIAVEVYLDPNRLSLGTRFYNRQLTELDNEVLDGIHFSGQLNANGSYTTNEAPKAILVWRGIHRIEVGPCRWARSVTSGTVSPHDIFSVTGGGGWANIRRSEVQAVRHIDAMGWGKIKPEAYLHVGH